ncbi:MAG: uroporphyrinogen-III synthase [Campylobacterota bacterium]|nr:uroporphyrinogen-III synthase [Campylobacterota bacterium]
MMGVVHIPILSVHFFTPEINFNLYTGIIITSKQAAQALKHYSPNWDQLQVICVGEATASAVEALGARFVQTADGYGMSITEVLSQHQGKWLYLRPKMIASSWPSYARELGITVDEVIIYETRCNEDMQKIEIAKNGVLIFTSPSSIECFCKRADILPTHDVVVIGTTTQNALPPEIKSTISSQTSLISCIEKAREVADR